MISVRQNGRRVLLYAALFSAVFVVYGSLLPFDFHTRSLEEIRAAVFSGGASVVSASITDRLVNLLLAVPTAFLAFGAFWRSGKIVRNFVAVICVLAFCVLLAAVVEFLQLFLPTRTSSLADIIAQFGGALFGISLWPIFGGAVLKIVERLSVDRPALVAPPASPNRALRLLPLIYLALLPIVNGWLNGSWLSLAEAAAKARDVHLAPFYYAYFANFFVSVYSICGNFLFYLPVGIAYWLYTHGTGRRFGAALAGGGIAFIMEAGKLFIATKNPDSTNVLLAAVSSVTAFTLWPRIYPRTDVSVPGVGDEANQHVLREENGSSLRSIVFRTIGSLCFVVVVAAVYRYPVASVWLAAALAVYALVLTSFPAIWLVVIPALLPSFDLAPWTGWFFLDEFDLFLLITIGTGLWLSASRPARIKVPGVVRGLLVAIGISCLTSLTIGLWPLQPIDANAFANYYSHYNAFRSAKGILELTGLLPLLFYNIDHGTDVMRRLSAGMAGGLATVIVASLWERAIFPGLFNLTANFRISALFSSMHTGGSAIETYLVAALPFSIAAAHYRKSIFLYTVAVTLFTLGTYALFVTFSRGGYAGYAVVLLILVIGALFMPGSRRTGTTRSLMLAVTSSVTIGAILSLFILEGSFPRSRMARADADLITRFEHWRNVISMMDSDWSTVAFGMGLGRYPATDLAKNWSVRMPAGYRYVSERQNQFLRLGPGTVAYMEQIVAVQPGKHYTIALDLRGAVSGGSLNVMLCERTFFRSYNCVDAGDWAAGQQANWRHREVGLDSGPLGSGPWFFRRTVKLILENTSSDTAVDVDNVRLVDNAGFNLVANGDFSHGADRWLYTSFDHWRWHIENIWVQIFFEQGVFGISVFVFMLAIFFIALSRAAWTGEFVYTAVLASITGCLTVGLFGSPLDVPRLSFLFYFLVATVVLCASASVARAQSPADPALGSAEGISAVGHPDIQDHTAAIGRAHYEYRAAKETGIPDPSKLVKAVLQLFAGICVLVAAGWLVMHSSMAPYNIRDLLHPVHPVLSLFVLATFLYWSLGFPVVIAFSLTRSTLGVWLYPAIVVLHSAVAWILLTYAVSFDRILKIVGTPVLYWHWYWEPAGRFLALFSAVSLSVTLGILIALFFTRPQMKAMAGFVSWIITATAFSPILYWAVVTKAATDNLVELMAGGGTPLAAVLLSSFIVLTSLGGSLLIAQLGLRNARWRAAALFVVAVSVPLAYLAFIYGTNNTLEKYGQVFSAMQFLLSQNREHYATGWELALRYLVFDFGLIGTIAFLQYPFVAWLNRHGTKAPDGHDQSKETL